MELTSPRENVYVKQEWNVIKKYFYKNMFLSVL